MSIKSMTGFGEGSASEKGISISVEISSVNRKQLDVNISLPRNLVALDALVQSQVRHSFSRGRISGIIRVENTDSSASTVELDEILATQYVAELRQVAEELNLPDNLGAESLVRLPGLLSVTQKNIDTDQISTVLGKALEKALKALSKMRITEGKALEKDLRDRLSLLEKQVEKIQKLAPKVVPDYREKLFQRLEKAGMNDLATDERVVKEIALFADRCDITEELTRLKSHLSQARKLLRSTEPAGRTLDFLCQELFREINTIGSKANELEITRCVVDFKTELERIREQVQNVE